MQVRMKVEVSGTRNGEKWPPRGAVVEVGDDEGAQLCAAGLAAPVRDDKVETAVPSTDDVEERADDTPPADDLEVLREQAKSAGVKVDKRWGEDRLRQELADAAGK